MHAMFKNTFLSIFAFVFKFNHMNVCVSGQHYDPANYNMALNNPLGPGYSGESDQVVSTSQAEHPRHAMNHDQVMYHGQSMYPSPVLNPCQVMSYSDAMEPVFHPVSMTAIRQESSMRITDQSQFLNAYNQLSHQKCRSNYKAITDFNNTKKTMIKVKQEERQCGTNDDVIITDYIIPRRNKFKLEISREGQGQVSHIEEKDQSTDMEGTDQQTLETRDHIRLLKESNQSATLEDQDQCTLIEAQELSTKVEAQEQRTSVETHEQCILMEAQEQSTSVQAQEQCAIT